MKNPALSFSKPKGRKKGSFARSVGEKSIIGFTVNAYFNVKTVNFEPA